MCSLKAVFWSTGVELMYQCCILKASCLSSLLEGVYNDRRIDSLYNVHVLVGFTGLFVCRDFIITVLNM